MTVIEPRPEEEYWPYITFSPQEGVKDQRVVDALKQQYNITTSVYSLSQGGTIIYARVPEEKVRDYFKARLEHINFLGDSWFEDSEHPFVVPQNLEAIVSRIKVNNLLPTLLLGPLIVKRPYLPRG